jgi:hypothetical protein
MKRLLILSLTFLILFSSPAQRIDPAQHFDPAQQFDPARLDSLFNTLTARNLAMGSISITQNGKLVYQRTVGKDQDQTAAYRIGHYPITNSTTPASDSSLNSTRTASS